MHAKIVHQTVFILSEDYNYSLYMLLYAVSVCRASAVPVQEAAPNMCDRVTPCMTATPCCHLLAVRVEALQAACQSLTLQVVGGVRP